MVSDGLKHKENMIQPIVQCMIVKFDLTIMKMQSP